MALGCLGPALFFVLFATEDADANEAKRVRRNPSRTIAVDDSQTSRTCSLVFRGEMTSENSSLKTYSEVFSRLGASIGQARRRTAKGRLTVYEHEGSLFVASSLAPGTKRGRGARGGALSVTTGNESFEMTTPSSNDPRTLARPVDEQVQRVLQDGLNCNRLLIGKSQQGGMASHGYVFVNPKGKARVIGMSEGQARVSRGKSRTPPFEAFRECLERLPGWKSVPSQNCQ